MVLSSQHYNEFKIGLSLKANENQVGFLSHHPLLSIMCALQDITHNYRFINGLILCRVFTMFTSVSSILALSGWVSALEKKNLGDAPQPVFGTFAEVTFIFNSL